MSAQPKACLNGVELSEDDRVQMCIENLGWTEEQARRAVRNAHMAGIAQSGDRMALEFARLHARIAQLEHECASLRMQLRAADTIAPPAEEHAPTLPSTPAAIIEESGTWTKK